MFKKPEILLILMAGYNSLGLPEQAFLSAHILPPPAA
jgi:hypothetical protein